MTLGPPCRDVATLVELLKAGCTAVRVDLTWGPVAYHKQSLRNVAEACKATGKLCAVIVDTVGRELVIRRPFTLDSEARCPASSLRLWSSLPSAQEGRLCSRGVLSRLYTHMIYALIKCTYDTAQVTLAYGLNITTGKRSKCTCHVYVLAQS